MSKLVLSLFIGIMTFVLSFSVANGQTPINSCIVIDASGNYELASSFSTNQSACINIAVNNVQIDCQGFTIDTVSAHSIFTATVQTNTTIENCIINTVASADVFDFANPVDIIIRNNTITGDFVTGGFDGISLTTMTGVSNISGNVINGYGRGIVSGSGSTGYTVSNNTINGSQGSGLTVSGVQTNGIWRENVVRNSGTFDASIEREVLFYNNLLMTLDKWINADVTTFSISTTLQTGNRITGLGNLIGGNAYTDDSITLGHYGNCTDADTDGICDSSVSFTLVGTITDLLPLSDEFAPPDPDAPLIENIVTEPTTPQVNSPDDFSNLTVQFNATITDNVAIDTVVFQLHDINVTPSQSGNDFFTSQSVICNGTAPINDWRFIATDTSGNQNVSSIFSFDFTCTVSPEEAPITGAPATMVVIISIVLAVGVIAFASREMIAGKNPSIESIVLVIVIGFIAIAMISSVVSFI